MAAFYDPATNELHNLSSADGHDVSGWIEVPLPIGYDERVHRFDGSAWTENWSALELALERKIDAGADATRREFIVEIAGQANAYRLKGEEAIAWTPLSDPADFPYLQREAIEKNTTIALLVPEILAIATLWRAIDPFIEGKRTGAKAAMRSAATVEAKEAAADVDWDAVVASALSS